MRSKNHWRCSKFEGQLTDLSCSYKAKLSMLPLWAVYMKKPSPGIKSVKRVRRSSHDHLDYIRKIIARLHKRLQQWCHFSRPIGRILSLWLCSYHHVCIFEVRRYFVVKACESCGWVCIALECNLMINMYG